MEAILESYFSTLSTIKRDREHLNEMMKKKEFFCKQIYKHMISTEVDHLEYKGKKIKIREVKPLEVRRNETRQRKLERRRTIEEKVRKASEEEEILKIIFEEFRLPEK